MGLDALLSVVVEPGFATAYDTMRVGALQHLDRAYTYDVVPEALRGGVLFQGVHRPAAGTAVTITLTRPATIYFFFHHTVDGGYGDIFAGLPGWARAGPAPQYDIHNGDHGHRMVMYRLDADAGAYAIPPTTRDRACFSIVAVERG